MPSALWSSLATAEIPAGRSRECLNFRLEAKQAEKALLIRSTQSHEGELSRGRTRMRELRGADAAKPVGKEDSP